MFKTTTAQKESNKIISARNGSEDGNNCGVLGSNTKSTAKKAPFLVEDFSANDQTISFSEDGKFIIFSDGDKREVYQDDEGNLHLKPTSDDLKIFKYIRLASARAILWNKQKADDYKSLKSSKAFTGHLEKSKTQVMFVEYFHNGKLKEIEVEKGTEDKYFNNPEMQNKYPDYKVIYKYKKVNDLSQHRTCLCQVMLSDFSFSKNTENEVEKTEFKSNSDKTLSFYETSKGDCFTVGQFMCSSVWTCPVCSAKISEARRIEIAKAFETHRKNGGYEYKEVITKKGNVKREATNDTDSGIYLFTLTLPHYKKDDLKELMKNIRQAVKYFKESGTYKTALKNNEFVGEIRALEVTWSKANAWHPHFHSVMFFSKILDKEEINKMKENLLKLWQSCCLKSGLKKPNHRGLDIQNGSHANEYINKWGIEHEVSKWVSKKAVGSSLTPFEILDQYRLTTSSSEKAWYKKLYNEYAEAFKGFRQLYWSPGLKEKLGVNDDLTDEELANKLDIDDSTFLGSITDKEWSLLKDQEYYSNMYRIKIPFSFTVSRYVKKYGFQALKDYVERLNTESQLFDEEENPFLSIDKQESEIISIINDVKVSKNKLKTIQSIFENISSISKVKLVVKDIFSVNIEKNIKKQLSDLRKLDKNKLCFEKTTKQNLFGRRDYEEINKNNN